MKRFLCGVLAALMLVVLCACGKQETNTVRLSEVTHSVIYAPQYVALRRSAIRRTLPRSSTNTP